MVDGWEIQMRGRYAHLDDRSLRRHDPDQVHKPQHVLRLQGHGVAEPDVDKLICRPNLSALAAPPSVRRMVAQASRFVNLQHAGSDQALLAEAHMALAADHQMVVQRDA